MFLYAIVYVGCEDGFDHEGEMMRQTLSALGLAVILVGCSAKDAEDVAEMTLDHYKAKFQEDRDAAVEQLALCSLIEEIDSKYILKRPEPGLLVAVRCVAAEMVLDEEMAKEGENRSALKREMLDWLIEAGYVDDTDYSFYFSGSSREWQQKNVTDKDQLDSGLSFGRGRDSDIEQMDDPYYGGEE